MWTQCLGDKAWLSTSCLSYAGLFRFLFSQISNGSKYMNEAQNFRSTLGNENPRVNLALVHPRRNCIQRSELAAAFWSAARSPIESSMITLLSSRFRQLRVQSFLLNYVQGSSWIIMRHGSSIDGSTIVGPTRCIRGNASICGSDLIRNLISVEIQKVTLISESGR